MTSDPSENGAHPTAFKYPTRIQLESTFILPNLHLQRDFSICPLKLKCPLADIVRNFKRAIRTNRNFERDWAVSRL